MMHGQPSIKISRCNSNIKIVFSYKIWEGYTQSPFHTTRYPCR